MRIELTLTDLETVYDTLAQALDEVGSDKSELFLVKLALLQAEAAGTAEAFVAHVNTAKMDL